MSTPITVFGKALKKDEYLHLNEFLFLATRLINQRKITFLYRGDTLENISSRLNVNYPFSKADRGVFFERLFMIGEKARHFHSQKIKPLSASDPIRIDAIDEDAFARIFDYINVSTKSKNTYHKAFFDSNSSFREFFYNKKNRISFLTSVGMMSKDQLMGARNHYFTLLHQLGAINYKGKSHLISTSTDRQVAGEFAGTSKSRVIIHAWRPSAKMIKGIVNEALPVYNGVPYYRQREHSVMAGILPHYILGLEVLEKQRLVLNPNLFINPISEESFSEGLDIDQSKFNDILAKSNYSRGYIDLNGKLFEI